MSSESSPLPADRDLLAAELALGLLEGAELAEALRLQLSDPVFAAGVEAWSHRLAPLLGEVADAEPPTGLFERIVGGLTSSALTDIGPRLRRWQWATGLTTAIAASLAVALVLKPSQVTQVEPARTLRGPMVAMIEGGTAHLVASWNGAGQVIVVPVEIPPPPTGKVHELWMIPKDGKPRSMGLVAGGPLKLAVNAATGSLLAQGASFAVSVEPDGGSPSGQPTGRVIASGRLVAA